MAKIEDLIEDFLQTKISPNTKRTYRAILNEYFKDCDSSRLKEISYHDVIYYRDTLLKGQKDKTTINKKLACLRGFFSYLAALGVLIKNPADRNLVKGFRITNISRTLGLNRVEIKSLLDACNDGTVYGLRDKAVSLLGIIEGLRRSEIAHLKMKDITSEEGILVLLLRDTKSGDFYKVKLKAMVKEAINKYIDALPIKLKFNDHVFISLSNNSKGKPLSDHSINDIIKHRCQKAGIAKRITSHSLRHTCVTLALEGGAPIPKVQAHVRHKDPKTTIRYYRELANLKKSAVDYIDL
ncbi:MAG: tyrosine-type recombinase/integrase [Planctomycetes bacterium]|nr:tyrosine-type recombinase/integrase [Planctomycetota bacterium]